MFHQSINDFIKSRSFAVAGASQDQAKYGNLIFRKLVASGRQVFPLNPTANQVEGHEAYPSLDALPFVPEALSIVTPPAITENVVADATRLGVKHLWMQPGAESPVASQAARAAGLNVIDDGSCILVILALVPGTE